MREVLPQDGLGECIVSVALRVYAGRNDSMTRTAAFEFMYAHMYTHISTLLIICSRVFYIPSDELCQHVNRWSYH